MLGGKSYGMPVSKPALRDTVGAARQKVGRIVIAFLLHRVTALEKRGNERGGVLKAASMA